MPTETAHIRQATDNSTFLATFDLNTTAHPDWAITVAFYTALHLVEARLARQNIDSPDHSARNKNVSRHLLPIRPDYMQLYIESRRARYYCDPITRDDARRVITKHYEPVRAHLCKALGLLL